jgi:hypothetical protein
MADGPLPAVDGQRRRRAAIVAALVLLFAAAPARGQQIQPPPFQPPLFPSDADVGEPVLPGEDPRPFRLSGRLRLGMEYNDNVFRLERNPRDELRESLTPAVMLRLVARDLRMSLTYEQSLVHSSVTDEDVLLFHALDATASYALTERLTLSLADRFVENDDPALSDPRGARRGRTTVTQNTVTTDLAYRREPWTLTPRYSLTTTRTKAENQLEGPAEERATVHTLGADAALSVFRRTTVAAGYDLTLADFEPGDDFVGHRGRASLSRALDPVMDASVRGMIIHRDVRAGRDFDIYRGDVGVRRDVGPRYSIEVRAGYAVFAPERGDTEQLPEYLVRGTYVGRSVRVTATAGQSFQETFLEAQNVGVTRTQEATLEARYETADRVALVLRGFVAENRFLQQSTAPATPVARRELLVGGGLGLDVRLTRRLSLGVGYDYTHADSSLRGFDYAQNRVRVGLTATYD